MKLGELLISAGKITSAQLEETLREQAIFGGRFGTNLVEMGYLDEHELAHFLSKKAGVPHASTEQLMNIPPQVIRLVPEDLVKRYRVVPVALNHRKLSLAMTDPSDFASIDEISFVTGCIIVPLIMPEFRIISAMEKYYSIRREQRYIPVAGGGRNRMRAEQVLAAAPAAQAVPVRPPSPTMPAPSEPEEILELPPLDEFECFGDQDVTEIQVPAPVSLSAAVAAVAAPVEMEQDYSLNAVLHGLTQAHDRHSIADFIVGHAAQQFNRAALFLLKGDKATGWVARVAKKPLAGFDTLEISLREPSQLQQIAESKTYYLGPMPVSPGNSRIITALGGDATMNHLLVPLIMMGRVVAILYLEGGSSPHLEQQVPELQQLLGKGSMALEILILKSKILLTLNLGD